MSVNTFEFPFTASADLSAKRGCIIRLTGATSLIPDGTFATDGLAATGQKLSGVLIKGIASGKRGVARQGGIIDYALAGDTLTPGTTFELTTDSLGRWIPATTGTFVCGYLIGTRTVSAGERFTCALNFNGRVYNTTDATTLLTGRKVTVSVGSESSNKRILAIQVVDLAGTSKSETTNLIITVATTGSGTITLTDEGSGSIVAKAANGVRTSVDFQTTSGGAAQVGVTLAAAETAIISIEPALVSGTNTIFSLGPVVTTTSFAG